MRRLRLLAACAALALPSIAGAWPAPMHESIAEQAGRLMPLSLQRILAAHIDELKRGAVAPLSFQNREILYLHADGRYGSLDEAALKQTQRVLDLLEQRQSMGAVAYEMGVLSHLVAAAQDPVNVSAEDPREAEWAPSFERYAAAQHGRFQVVFDGYLSPHLARDDVRGFVRSLAERSRRHYPILSHAYLLEDGSVASNSSFDDRHPVFGVASLAYSHAIADTAKLWLYAWIHGNGDTTDLPFPQAFDPVALTAQGPER